MVQVILHYKVHGPILLLSLWDVDNTTWGNWTNSGDVDLSAYKSSSTYIAYEYFGSSSSGSMGN